MLPFQTENCEWKPRLFLSPFTICSSCKQKLVVCPFVDKETCESYMFANGLKRDFPINANTILVRNDSISNYLTGHKNILYCSWFGDKPGPDLRLVKLYKPTS